MINAATRISRALCNPEFARRLDDKVLKPVSFTLFGAFCSHVHFVVLPANGYDSSVAGWVAAFADTLLGLFA